MTDDLERIEAPEVSFLPCANSECPDGAMVPAVTLYGQVFPSLCDRCFAKADEAQQSADHRHRIDLLMAQSGVTERLREWSLDTYPSEGEAALVKGLSWLQEYRSGERRDLYIFGGVGRGKTGLAWSVMRALVQVDLVSSRFVIWRNLLAEMTESFDSARRVTTEPLRRLPVLVLDDIGAEPPTDWRRDELATLIEERYQRRLPTIYTSNYDLVGLRLRFGHDDPVIGERIVSRIAEDARRIEVTGRDWRQRRPPSSEASGPAEIVK